MSAKITVKLVRSPIGCMPKHRKTLEALGLKKIRQVKTFESTPTHLGMVEAVKHLLEVSYEA